LVRKLDLEASWRHDQYNGTLKGGTSNPKLAFTWLIDDQVGATFAAPGARPFRFANAGEYSTVLSDNTNRSNLLGEAAINLPCTAVRRLLEVRQRPCSAPVLNAANSRAWDHLGWRTHPDLRSYLDGTTGQLSSREGGLSLAPEKSINYSMASSWLRKPFLKGFDAQSLGTASKSTDAAWIQQYNWQHACRSAATFPRYFTERSRLPGCGECQPCIPRAIEKMASAALLDRNATET
jgi:hypothetical protein